MNQIYLLKTLSVVFLIKSATSLEDATLNDLSLNTAVYLIKNFAKYENIRYILLQPSDKKQKDYENNIEKNYNAMFYEGVTGDLEDRQFQRPRRKILIKRLLPHGLPPSKLEFDRKYKSFYRPLVRVHKRKRLPKIGAILNVDGTTDGMDKYGIDTYDYYDNDGNVLKFATNKGVQESLKRFKIKKEGDFDVDAELAQPFVTNFVEHESSNEELPRIKTIQEIQKIIDTLTRPLVRVHKRKRLPKIGAILNVDGTTDGMDKYGIDTYDYYDNDGNVLKFATNKGVQESLKRFKIKKEGDFGVDAELAQPFVTNFVEHESPNEVLPRIKTIQEIQKIIDTLTSPSNNIDEDTKELEEKATLRAYYQKSGEDNDPMAPGKVVNLDNEEVNEAPQRPKKWIPHYAPWNFWTYKKTIYQDVCPKGQVKIANLCITLPPH